jgi:iron complex transport system substrate-binding protein
MRLTPKLLAFPLAAMLAVGCGDGDATPSASTTTNASADYPMTLQNCARKVTIDKRPQRILTVGSDPAAAVAAAGAADRIVGRSSEGGAPLGPYESALGSVPKLTTNDAPSLEAVIGKRPDILVSYELGETELPSGLADSGIEALTPDWRCDQGSVGFEDIYTQIEQLGKVFGTSDVADAAVAKLRSRQAVVEKRFEATGKRTAAAIYVSESGLSAYANRSVDHSAIEALGLTDAFADVDKRVIEVNLEELIKRNPDVIIATYGGSGTDIKNDAAAIKALRGRPGVNRLAAVRDKRIIPLHFGYLVGGPLAVDGLETIAIKLETFK